MYSNLQFPADLVIFTEEILNGKVNFLCNEIAKFSWKKIETMDQRVHNFQFTQIGKIKRRQKLQLLILSAYEANKTLKTMQK